MSKILKCATRAAYEAGKLVCARRDTITVDQKASNNLVTEADRDSERLIVNMIQESYPDAMFLGEEGTTEPGAGLDAIWIIDPIDGTNNYAHGIPLFSVSIAYVRNGSPVAGVVYDPVRDEMFSALAGGGAFCNGKPIHVSGSQRLPDCIFATGFYYDRGEIMERTLDAVRMLFQVNIRGIRRTGSAALDQCWCAAGRFDGFFEYKLSPWDFAAGMLLVREAGGVCSDRAGGSLNVAGTGVIMSNREVHHAFADIVRWRE